MGMCRSCGANGQNAAFCTHCGMPMATAPAPTAPQSPGQPYPAPAWANVPPPNAPHGPGQPYQAPSWAAVPPPAPDRKPPWLLIGAVVATVAILAAAAVLLFRKPSTVAQPVPVPAITTQPATPSSAVRGPAGTTTPSATSQSGDGGGVGPVVTRTMVETLTTTAAPSSSSAPSRTAPASTGKSSTGTARSAPKPRPTPVNPMGGPNADFQCTGNVIVQIASEVDVSAFRARVAQLRADGLLPGGAKWIRAGAACGIFGGDGTAYVLYAGPYANPIQACATRLVSPADSFLRSTSASGPKHFSCLCQVAFNALPQITTVGQQQVWVGEAQYLLYSTLEYKISGLDGEAGVPNAWGVYTQETADAVLQFQQDRGIIATGAIDGQTWQALQGKASCAG